MQKQSLGGFKTQANDLRRSSVITKELKPIKLGKAGAAVLSPASHLAGLVGPHARRDQGRLLEEVPLGKEIPQ